MVRQLERFEGSNPSVKKQIHLFRTPLTYGNEANTTITMISGVFVLTVAFISRN